MIFFLILLVVFFVATAAFYSGVETAVVSVDKPLLIFLAEKGNKKAKLAVRLISSPSRLMSTLLIAQNIAYISASSIATVVVAHYFGSLPETLVTTLIMTPVIVLFGELVPKSIGRGNSQSYTLISAYILRLTEKVLGIFVTAMSLISKGLLRIFGIKEAVGDVTVTREEVSALADISMEQGVIGSSEHRMIRRVFEMNRTRLASVMAPLIEFDIVSEEATIADALDVATKHEYAQLPVYAERTDNIIGLVRVVELLEAAYTQKRDDPLGNLIDRTVPFMPETKPVAEMLRELRRERTPVIFVVDEYGGVSGMITVHDLAEEIVGELAAERPEERSFIVSHRGGIECEGRTDVDVLGEKLGLEFDKDGYDTIAGLILLLAGHIPNTGETYTYKNLKMTVLRADPKRIIRVRIEQNAPRKSNPTRTKKKNNYEC
jgi:putative hemolysin